MSWQLLGGSVVFGWAILRSLIVISDLTRKKLFKFTLIDLIILSGLIYLVLGGYLI